MKKNLIFLCVVLLILVFVINKIFFPKMKRIPGTCKKIQVDKCFVINLPSSTDRYNTFIKNYSSKLPLEVLEAVDTRKPENAEKYKHLVDPGIFNKLYDFDGGKKRPNQNYLNSGALGCYLSHMKFYEKCFEQNLKYAIVFEDNVVLEKGFDEELDIALTNLGDDFDVCFLHCGGHLGKNVKKCDNTVRKIRFIMGTKCYLINVENMKKYYSLFYPIDTHVDRMYEKLDHSGVNVYLFNLASITTTKKSTIKHSGSDKFLRSMFNYSHPWEIMNLQFC